MKETVQKGSILTTILIGGALSVLLTLSIGYFVSHSSKKATQNTNESRTTHSPGPTIHVQAQGTPTTSQDSKEYTSQILKLSFEIPEGYAVTERFNDIFLKKEDKQIIVSSHGSFYDNSNEHINSLEERNNFKFKTKTPYKENTTFEFIKTTSEDPNNKTKVQTSFYGVHNYNVAVIYSSDNRIESDMELIVRTFKFI